MKTVCKICYIEQEPHDLVTLPCYHEFCLCMYSHLEVAILVSDFMMLRCPEASCKTKLDEGTIKAIATPQLLEKYFAFAENKKVNMDENLFWCPRPGCNTYIDARLFTKNKGVCSTCSMCLCLKCGAQFHGNTSCKRIVDVEFKRWTAHHDVNPCPKCLVHV